MLSTLKTTISIIVIVVLILSGCQTPDNTPNKTDLIPISPPDADRKDTILTIHGDDRNDPYYWMRLSDDQKNAAQPDAHTAKVVSYLESENDFTGKLLEHTEEFQEKLYQEIIGRIKQDDESVPYFKNGYWYYIRYEQGNDYPIHCRKKGKFDADEEIMLDVNELAKGHDYYSAAALTVSPDNKLLAFGEDVLSRRVYKIRFKNLETGKFLPDELEGTLASGAWGNDNKSFFYTSKNKISLLSEKIWKHTLDEPQSSDELKYQEKDPSYYIGVYKSKSEKYIVIYNSSTLVSQYHILNADDPNGDFKPFSPRDKAHEYSIQHYEDKFYIVTNLDAPNFRLMETPENATSKENWEEVIAHREDVLLDDIEVFNNFLVIRERSNALTHLKIINQTSKEAHYVDFGEQAYVTYTSNNPEFDTEFLRYGYSSLTTPNSIFDYNMSTKEKELKKQAEVVGGHNPDDYQTERILAEGRDGTKIPISLVYRKGFKKNGKSPLMLYSYGSYGSSTDPWFNSVNLSLLDRGFAYALAHIRGGQEMGRHWYEDGKMFNKKNTFYDFIDCAKFLIDENYTSPDHLYARGGSAGGLLMGAVANMAPELFNGMVAAVPFVDVVTTMLDESIPLTSNEFDEWGNPKKPKEYEYMLSYSPYDNVKDQAYPNMLVTTGFFDSQVQYWEPAKWVAKLRDHNQGNNQILLKTNMKAGHGGASGRYERYREIAFEYSFVLNLEGKADLKD